MTKSTKQQVVVEVKEAPKYRVPNCVVNFVIVEDFEGTMKTLKLTKDSSVNNIMLALYSKYGTNLNPNVLANQIRKFKGETCKCSANCISWYKNHYNKDLNKFVSTKKKGLTKEQIIDKLYAIDEIKNSPVAEFIPALSLTKLKELATKYELA